MEGCCYAVSLKLTDVYTECLELPLTLNVNMLNVIMLSVVAPSQHCSILLDNEGIGKLMQHFCSA
jgi:hypothetical protein